MITASTVHASTRSPRAFTRATLAASWAQCRTSSATFGAGDGLHGHLVEGAIGQTVRDHEKRLRRLEGRND